ncbi:MAG: insulinase family protein [Bacteroides sp.]|nr:insulinase family protein [Bacteroides sp.]
MKNMGTLGKPYEIFTLSNGMRAVVRQTDSPVSYIGVVINAGSRDEPADRQGLAHFVEHTIFKGTSSRKSWHISNRMECIGGELNAYTSKEETMLYTNAPAGHAERAIELLSDIIADSRFPSRELDMEREVVIDEINSYLDSPSESVYDEFEERAYAGSALAHNILGTPESVRSLSSTDCRGFLDRHYTPANMVAYISDPGDPARLATLLEKHFGALGFPGGTPQRATPPPMQAFDDTVSRDGHQAHTVMGYRVFGRRDPRRFPLFLLNNHLGGPCMNSRLNQELRDKRGLVYTVDSSVALMSDTGLLQIYFGCDRKDIPRCRRLIGRELERLASDRLSDRAFRSIVNQYCGQMIVSSDNRENMAMSMGKSLQFFGHVVEMQEVDRALRDVTPEQLRDLAAEIASSPLGCLTIC